MVLAMAAGIPSAEAGKVPFQEWLKGVRSEAISLGIRPATLDAALSGVTLIPRVIELDHRQPEFTLTFRQYLDRVVPQSRVERAKRKLNENRAILEEVGRKFGVQPRFIVAFWGIETDFGRQKGGFSVIRAVFTLA